MGVGILQKLAAGVNVLTRADYNGVVDALQGHIFPRRSDGTLSDLEADIGGRNNRFRVAYINEIVSGDDGNARVGAVNAPFGGFQEFGVAGVAMKNYYLGNKTDVRLLTTGQFTLTAKKSSDNTTPTPVTGNFADGWTSTFTTGLHNVRDEIRVTPVDENIRICWCDREIFPREELPNGRTWNYIRAGATARFASVTPGRVTQFSSNGRIIRSAPAYSKLGPNSNESGNPSLGAIKFGGFSDPPAITIAGTAATITASQFNPVRLQFTTGVVTLTENIVASVPAYQVGMTNFVFVTAERQISVVTQNDIEFVARRVDYPESPTSGQVVFSAIDREWQQWNSAESAWQPFVAVLMGYRTNVGGTDMATMNNELVVRVDSYEALAAQFRARYTVQEEDVVSLNANTTTGTVAGTRAGGFTQYTYPNGGTVLNWQDIEDRITAELTTTSVTSGFTPPPPPRTGREYHGGP